MNEAERASFMHDLMAVHGRFNDVWNKDGSMTRIVDETHDLMVVTIPDLGHLWAVGFMRDTSGSWSMVSSIGEMYVMDQHGFKRDLGRLYEELAR